MKTPPRPIAPPVEAVELREKILVITKEPTILSVNNPDGTISYQLYSPTTDQILELLQTEITKARIEECGINTKLAQMYRSGQLTDGSICADLEARYFMLKGGTDV
jgi:hypothetical protein